MSTAIVAKGSVQDVATRKNTSLASAFLSVKLVILADRSGSMVLTDSAQGQARFQVEDMLVSKIQRENPGQVLLASFDDTPTIHPDGYLPHPGGGTMLLPALRKIQDFCVGDVRAVLISDGEPFESEADILKEVRANWRGKLDVYYAGPESGSGHRLMQRIAEAASGTYGADALNRNLPKLEQSIRLALHSGN